jgi:hypothetical protein
MRTLIGSSRYLLRIGIATLVIAWSTPAWSTPITVTFSGTVTSAAPIWSYWLDGFGVGVDIVGSVTGDTETPGGGVWAFNVAGHTGTANAFGPFSVTPEWVSVHANWNASISGATTLIGSYIAEMWLNPHNQTGAIYYSGIGLGPNGVLEWYQPWEATITGVAVHVPEASTIRLFGLGLLAVAARVRRQSQ